MGKRQGFPASYEGTCAVSFDPIDEGDLIVSTDDGWAHEECVDEWNDDEDEDVDPNDPFA